VYPQIYLGHTPGTGAERRALRALAIDLGARIQAGRAQEPTTLLLHFSAGAGPAQAIDLLLLRPNAVIVGALRAYHGPIVALPGARWTYRDGEPIREARDRTPIQHVRLQRDAVRDRLDQAAAGVLDPSSGSAPGAFERTIGALICVPSTHPESRISLDVNDHRQQLKVLGLDELPALAAMVRTGARLSEQAMRTIAAEVFAGRLWHDGTRFLFDLAPARFQLRVLADPSSGQGQSGARGERVLPLMEGETVMGRRRAPQQGEYRLTLGGDELISGDHALIAYDDGERVALRDISKNGTWMTPPGGTEERVRGERVIVAGTLLRMGMTRMQLERAEAHTSQQSGG